MVGWQRGLGEFSKPAHRMFLKNNKHISLLLTTLHKCSILSLKGEANGFNEVSSKRAKKDF